MTEPECGFECCGKAIPVLMHRRGNMSAARRDEVEQERTAAGADLFQAVVERDFDGIGELLREVAANRGPWQTKVDRINVASDANLAHQLRCSTCGHTERITGGDLRRLIRWAAAEPSIGEWIPLKLTRQILGELDKKVETSRKIE